MANNRFLDLQSIQNGTLFPPFKSSLDFLVGELKENEQEENSLEKLNKSSENHLTYEDEYATIKMWEEPTDTLDNTEEEDIVEDGAPNGNQNAAGPHKRWKMSEAEKTKSRKRLIGQRTSDGVEIKSVRDHALDRSTQRNISMKQIEAMMSSKKVTPDKQYPNSRRCYDIKGKRLVVDYEVGEIITVERRRQNK